MTTNHPDQCPVCDEPVNDADYFWHLSHHGLIWISAVPAGWFCICGERFGDPFGDPPKMSYSDLYAAVRSHATLEHLKPYITLSALRGDYDGAGEPEMIYTTTTGDPADEL